MTDTLKVWFLAAEAQPLIKVGGLGDVAGTLPPALCRLPQKPDVRLVLPLHQAIRDKGLPLTPVAAFTIGHVDGPVAVEAYRSDVGSLPVYLIAGKPIADMPAVYSSDGVGDGNKYVFFSLAALELARALDWQPDVLHAQDWHTAAAIYALEKWYRKDPFYRQTATLLTVHNLPFLGHEAGPALTDYGLPPASADSKLPEWARHMPLPLGLLTADKINTVSPGYAAEMLTPEFGAGLEGFLKTRKKDLLGILNGLDMESWDPRTDQVISHNYGADNLVDRKKNKAALQKEAGLPPTPKTPLLCIISRMDHQKGIDLALEALRNSLNLDWQAVILGNGDPALEAQTRQLAQDHPQRVKAFVTFDGDLARRMYAGADLILIPSRYEPCGLTQMIGMRYGCVPLARATGGLRDTIVDYDQDNQGNGFLFKQAAAPPLARALKRALETYKDQRRWRGLQLRGMAQDFSWQQAAQKYYDLYLNIISERK